MLTDIPQQSHCKGGGWLMLQQLNRLTLGEVLRILNVICRLLPSLSRMAAALAQSSSLRARTQLSSHRTARYNTADPSFHPSMQRGALMSLAKILLPKSGCLGFPLQHLPEEEICTTADDTRRQGEGS